MPVFEYSTPWPNVRLLNRELEAAGFTGAFLTTDAGTQTFKVYVQEGDPTPVVQAHNPIPDLPINVLRALSKINQGLLDAKTELDAAKTAGEIKNAVTSLGRCVRNTLKVIAYVAGELELNDAEFQAGELDLEA